jgi:hypothetical protein
MRFINWPGPYSFFIPPGSVITSAYIILYSVGGYGTIDARIYGEATDDAVEVTSGGDFYSRVMTNSYVPWNAETWPPDQSINSPSIVSIIQELVDRPGRAAGGSIQVFWRNNNTIAGNNYRSACSKSQAYAPPWIHIEYTVPPVTSTVSMDAILILGFTPATSSVSMDAILISNFASISMDAILILGFTPATSSVSMDGVLQAYPTTSSISMDSIIQPTSGTMPIIDACLTKSTLKIVGMDAAITFFGFSMDAVLLGAVGEELSTFDCRVELWNSNTLVEILNPKIESLTWGFARVGGCDQCDIILKAQFSDYSDVICGSTWRIKIKVRIEGSMLYVQRYLGTILLKNPVFEEPEKISFTAVGLIQQTQKAVVYTNPVTGEPAVFANCSVSEIAANIIDNYVEPYTDIIYDVDLISPCLIVPESITFDTSALQVIQTLGTLGGNYEWGVRADGKFYFTEKSSIVGWDFFLGQPEIDSIDYSTDAGDITNRLHLSGAEGLNVILEDEADVATIQQSVKNTAFNFGRSIYQELIQTFIGILRLKTLTLNIGKVGFAELIVDGNMETSGTAYWLDYIPKSGRVIASKVSYDDAGTNHYLDVNPTGKVNGKHQEVDGLTGEYTLSFRYKVNIKIYPMSLQIFSLTSNSQILLNAAYDSKTWMAETVTFTVGTDEDIDIRFTGARFSLDDVSLKAVQDDLEISIVNRSNPDVLIKSVIISGSDITTSSKDFKLDLTIDKFHPITQYGFRISRTGDLSDSDYYFINGANNDTYLAGTLEYYDGSWHDTSKDVYFKITYSKSGAIHGIKSERIKNASLSQIEDAQLWANSYLAAKEYPNKTATVRLTSKTLFFDYEPQINGNPIPLVFIRETGDSPLTKIQYFINRIQYTLIDNGLAIELELGTRQKKITDYLAWIEWQIDQLNQLVEASGIRETTGYTPIMTLPSLPSQVQNLVIADGPLWVDPESGETHATVTVTFDQNSANEYVYSYEILYRELVGD